MTLIPCPHNGEVIELKPQAFTDYCEKIHKFNTQWWLVPGTGERKERNVGEMLMLAVSELAEGMEAHRKNLQDEHLPQYHGLDVELVDSIIRSFDLLGARYAERIGRDGPSTYSPGDVFRDKCKFNAQRKDHRPENRTQPGGKAY
jgi:hypothetical protein